MGHQAGRPDLIDLALAGAADVVSRDEAGPAGFLVTHSDPQHRPDRGERYSFGWCHGPAGDAQAGVLALACDRHAEARGDLTFATMLAGDLAARATVDCAGVRWANEEYRATPSGLQPRTGWAMGSAGIIRELLRFSRAIGGLTRPTPSPGQTTIRPAPALAPNGPIPPGLPGCRMPAAVSGVAGRGAGGDGS